MTTRSKHNFNIPGFDYNSDYDEPQARSSPGLQSSPVIDPSSPPSALDEIKFGSLEDLPDNDPDDHAYQPDPSTPTRRASPLNNVQKARKVLDLMKSMNDFSLRALLETLFTSQDPTLTNTSNKYMASGRFLTIIDTWWTGSGGFRNQELCDWVMEKAARICSRESSWLAERASAGPYEEEAKFLRVSACNVTVQMVNEFRLANLTKLYGRVLPQLQKILDAVVAKSGETAMETEHIQTRDPSAGKTLIVSALLNLRSRRLNYHATMNSLIFWDNRVSKRLTQAFNIFGITSSSTFQSLAVTALSKSSLSAARLAANNLNKIKMLPYDNFNWISRAWEATALHGSITHDQVSALLVILPTPAGASAQEITDISHFSAHAETRHQIPPSKSLLDIIPNHLDQAAFRQNAIIHVQHILTSEIKCLSSLKTSTPTFSDASAITPSITEEYYLPTFDQEQGSTRGNMVVLEHYFGKVLAIPMARFEEEMFTVLGDRLTTARDRAAQDQRAVDRSENRFDHLSSFTMTSGLMHFCLNFIHALGGNYWGSDGATDAVSLLTLRNVLPNRSDLNLRKVDYYAWLRFLEVTLCSLILGASAQLLGSDNVELAWAGESNLTTPEHLTVHATILVDSFLLPSVDRLEACNVKKLKGATHSGHATTLMHDLMTLREMRDAIKHGHPGRIARMLKYWLPMFYAGGSYNYANECMELLHNLYHDWPKDYADVAFKGMLVNPTGKRNGFKEADLHVEHLNGDIKERAVGSNATPRWLEKITPAMGHVSSLTDQLFEDIGVERLNQRHSKVSQHADIQILAKHIIKNKIFNFSADCDKVSKHLVVDLYRMGCIRLAGPDGGHAKHLKRHILRLRTRHATNSSQSELLQNPATDELSCATDAEYRSRTVTNSDPSEIFNLEAVNDTVDENEDYF